mmetsp:Transcript_62271/g.148625  ORF Transcript_62271/g.148625 Transcript_62271/m.148625 type:complete len:358 (+) Transcript_62271:51-1124(+)
MALVMEATRPAPAPRLAQQSAPSPVQASARPESSASAVVAAAEAVSSDAAPPAESTFESESAQMAVSEAEAPPTEIATTLASEPLKAEEEEVPCFSPAPAEEVVDSTAVPAVQSTPVEVVSPATVTATVDAAPAKAAARTPVVTAKAERAKPLSLLTAKELRETNMEADLYSILVATERLEAAFIRGVVANEDYERNCMQLIAQFKTLRTALRDKCPDIKAFAREHGLNCPLAEERLLGAGLAATALLASGTSATTGSGKESLACFKASEALITLSDALKLKLDAVDDLLPLVRDLQARIAAIPSLPPLPGLERMQGWLVTLNNMRAADQLSEDQCRQLVLDVDQAYASLEKWLQEK